MQNVPSYCSMGCMPLATVCQYCPKLVLNIFRTQPHPKLKVANQNTAYTCPTFLSLKFFTLPHPTMHS